MRESRESRTATMGLAANTMRFACVLIIGHGRSGTNWLQDILDCSTVTHCRTEPNEHEGNPLMDVPGAWVAGEGAAALETGWDRAVAWTASRVGDRDHLVLGPKAHLRTLSKSLGLYRMLAGARYRKVLSTFVPRLRRLEWVMPWWIFDAKKLEDALLVMKLNQAPGWAVWVLNHRPNTAVLQIVRHPGGMLNSWKNRYVAGRDPDAVRQANQRRLEMISKADAEWAERFGDIRSTSVEEGELWFWRYASEVVHRVGVEKPAYMLVKYEDLADDVVHIAERIYQHLGLVWTPYAEAHIRAQAAESRKISMAWRSKLADEDLAAIETVLDGSVMEHWWDEQAVVSA